MFSKKISKALAIIISMVLIFAALPISGIASATEEEFTEVNWQNFNFRLSTGLTATVMGLTKEAKEQGIVDIVIPEKFHIDETGKTYTVTEIGYNSFSEHSTSNDIEHPIKSVILPDTIETIGDYAFYYCKSLETVSFGNSLQTIGKCAFEFCESLQSVNLPDSVITIGSMAFRCCNAIKSITLGSELKTIGDYAFLQARNVTEVIIPDKVEYIGDEAFCSCSLLETVVIPDSVKEIGWYAFRWCSALSNVTMGKNVEIIQPEAFYHCTSLKTITLPSTLKEIGYRTFKYCTSLESVHLSYGLEKIGDAAFQDCGSLKSINIPNSVTTIGNDAFIACRTLSSVQMSENVETIGDSAFSSCEALTSINLPSKITVIRDHMFMSCKSLKNIDLPNGLERIEGQAFRESGITSIDIPDTVTFIGGSAFAGCGELISANIPYGITSIETDTFGGCKKLSSIRIPSTVERIGNHAFSECESLEEITIPGGVNTIDYDSFAGCKKLYSVTILNGVEKIHYRAFENCTELKTVIIPSSVTSIESDAFRYSDNVVLTVAPGSYAVDYAKKYKFTYEFDCEPISLEKVTLPEKTVYPLGGEIDMGSIRIIALFENGETDDVIDFCRLEGYDMYTPGMQQVSIIYNRFTLPFEVTVDKDLVEYPESDHYYANNLNKTWKYNHRYPAEKLNIKFSEKTETEYWSDMIYIYNEDGSTVGRYHGTSLSGKTVTVTGRSFTIQLTSDGSNNKYGFSIDYIEIACDHERSVTTTPATYISKGVRTSCCEACGFEEAMPYGYALCDFNDDGTVNDDDYSSFESLLPEVDISSFDFDCDGAEELSNFDVTIIKLITMGKAFNQMIDITEDGNSDVRDLIRMKKLMTNDKDDPTCDRNGDQTTDSEDLLFVCNFILCFNKNLLN